jgi:hypothetical protein
MVEGMGEMGRWGREWPYIGMTVVVYTKFEAQIKCKQLKDLEACCVIPNPYCEDPKNFSPHHLSSSPSSISNSLIVCNR